MKVIGLTGGIGSGKTTVARMMEEQFDAYVIITDNVAKNFMEKGNISYMLTVEYFSDKILSADGNIDRKKLGDIVFNDSDKLKKLNSFSHPYVREYVLDKIKECRDSGIYSYLIVETALLLEAGYREFCDEVWYVHVDESIRRKRLKNDRGYSDKKIDEILNNQLSDENFMKICDIVIDNSSDMENIKMQLKKLLVK